MLPQINPYYFQQPNYQPLYQQTPQVNTLSGKLIDNIDSVTANDVPMQGISVFPKNDLSEVYIKSWTPQGTIQTYRFEKMPCTPPVNSQTTNTTTVNADAPISASYEVTEGIMNRLNDIESKLDRVLSSSKSRKAQNESSNDN